MTSQRDIYREHHATRREAGFSILKEERGRLIAELVGQGKEVLDIGCRDGALTQFFISGNTVLGIDIDDVALGEVAKLGVETLRIDLHGNWSEIRGRVFDVAVAGEVLEHLYYPEEQLKKILAILKPNGMLIGSVPNAFSVKNRLRYLWGTKRHTPLSDPTHINHFSAPELEALLKKYFEEVEIRGLGRYKRLSRWFPNLFSFDLFFVARRR